MRPPLPHRPRPRRGRRRHRLHLPPHRRGDGPRPPRHRAARRPPRPHRPDRRDDPHPPHRRHGRPRHRPPSADRPGDRRLRSLRRANLALDVPGRHGWRRVLHGVDLDLHQGEVLGIGGLLGSGRTEILETLFGASPGRSTGTIRLDGRPVEIPSPRAARRLGIALVTEDRKAEGLLLADSIRDNVALPSLGRISRFGNRRPAGEAAVARDTVRRLGVRCSGISQTAATLSGGNQQKVVIGKWLATGPRVLLLDEPTRGIDVGAKQEIYALIRALAAEGLAILMVSSELPELLLLADRILVMAQGRKTGELARAEASEEAIMHLAAPLRAAS